MLQRLRRIRESARLRRNRIRYHFFFKRTPLAGEYCNSKLIRLDKQPPPGIGERPYLVIVRCGGRHELINDCGERNFDIALNLYSAKEEASLGEYEYVFTGGISKFRAAYQFINEELLDRYVGFMFLDDDLKITHSQLNMFLAYCTTHGFGLAQPSLTRDSSCCYAYLVNASQHGWRQVPMVEVMCPYFSSSALREALFTFPLSDSSWGLDLIWPRLPTFAPVVVDEFAIAHVRPVGAGAFYEYMRSIGVSPRQEMIALRGISEEILLMARARHRFVRSGDWTNSRQPRTSVSGQP
jgi:hypothetical protein